MWCTILYIYLIIAVIIAIVYFIKSLFEITKEERQSLQIEDYVRRFISLHIDNWFILVYKLVIMIV